MMNSAWMDVPVRPHADQNLNGSPNPSVQTNPAWIGDQAANKYNLVQRYQLIPYYYTLAHRAHSLGLPVFQPLFMAFQEDPNVWSMGDQFMLGDFILISVDTKYETKSRYVYLPRGKWYDYHTHEQQETGVVERPLSRNIFGNTVMTNPVFVKSGSIVPKQWVDDMTMNSHGRRKDGSVVDTFIVRVWPDAAQSSFEVIDDDSFSPKYLAGEKTSTLIEQVLLPGVVQVTIYPTGGSFAGAPTQRQYAVDIVLPPQVTKISNVTINDQALDMKQGQGFPQPWKSLSGWTMLDSGRLAVAYSGRLATADTKVFKFYY
jgi:alpha-glucosidase